MIPFFCTANGIINLCLADLPRIDPLFVIRNPALETICAVARGGDARSILKVQ